LENWDCEIKTTKQQSVSTLQIDDRAATAIKKNVKTKETVSIEKCMEGSKETNRSSSKTDAETKMALNTDIQWEGGKEANISSIRKEVETKEVLNSNIQLADSHIVR
jgi:hypothetical protein